MHRLLFFGDSSSAVSSLLLERVLGLMSERGDFEVAAVCDASLSSARSDILRTAEPFLSFYLRRLFSPGSRGSAEILVLPRVRRICRQHGIPLLRPPANDINHPDFMERLREDLHPDWVFSCYCPQIFGSQLLAVFESAINYHNGLLPEYRGLHATAWSMYHRERETGFTFHYMTERIDDGRILLQRSLPVTSGSSYRELEINKALLARSSLSQVLDMLVSGEKGTEPRGRGSYFSRKAWTDLTTIDDSRSIAAPELLHRLKCFQILRIRIGECYYPVTDLVELTNRKPSSFHTKDGVIMRPKRFLYLPYLLFKVYQLVNADLE